jgi:hypothetical protein
VKEFDPSVQRKKSICRICEDVTVAIAKPIQCLLDAIEVTFLRLQAHVFAKRLPDARTYLVCTHPIVPMRKQPKYGEGEEVSREAK